MITFACLLLVAAPGCGTNGTNGGSNAGSGNGATGDGGTGIGSDLDGDGGTPSLPPFVNPWTRARVGDTAVYRTPRAPEDGETWTLVDDSRVQISWGAGTDEMGFPVESTEMVPVDRDAEGQWWSQPRPAAEPDGSHTLADGTELPTYTIVDGDRTFVVSPQAPFDGVVSETVAGRDTPIRELVSFARPDPAGSDPDD